jgi:hypothetical protein
MKSAQGRAFLRVSGVAIVAVAAIATATGARAADQSFTSYARDLRSGKLLYVESHYVHNAQQADELRIVLYRCSPNGAAFARKELSYGAAREEPQFSYTEARSGYLEGLRRTTVGLQVFQRANARAPQRQAAVPSNIVIVSDAGFDEFVRKHWSDLEAGTAVKFPFLVPSRLDYLTFKISKHGEGVIEGSAVSVIRLNLSGILGWFLPYIEVSYRKSDRLLMRYKGLTNVRDTDGDNYTAQIDFPSRERLDAPVDLAAVKATPLVSRCP